MSSTLGEARRGPIHAILWGLLVLGLGQGGGAAFAQGRCTYELVQESRPKRADGANPVSYRTPVGVTRTVGLSVFYPKDLSRCSEDPETSRLQLVLLSDGAMGRPPGKGTVLLAESLARSGYLVVLLRHEAHDPETLRRYCSFYGVPFSECNAEISRFDLPYDLHEARRQFDRWNRPTLPEELLARLHPTDAGMVGVGRNAAFGVLALAQARIQLRNGITPPDLSSLDGLSSIKSFVALVPPGIDPDFNPGSFDRMRPGTYLLVPGAEPEISQGALELFERILQPEKALIHFAELPPAELRLDLEACQSSNLSREHCGQVTEAVIKVLGARLKQSADSLAFLASGARGKVSVSRGAPQIEPIGSLSLRTGELLNLKLPGVTPDPIPLVYSCVQCPEGSMLDPYSGRLYWTPSASQDGSREVTVRASDGFLSGERSFSIGVGQAQCSSAPQVSISGARTTTPGIDRSYVVSVFNPNPEGECAPMEIRFNVVLPSENAGWDSSVSRDHLTLPARSLRKMIVTVKSPENAKPGNYRFQFLVKLKENPMGILAPSVFGDYLVR